MNGSEHGIFEMRGDARGIEAWSQGMHGLIEGAKNVEGQAPSTHTVYMQKEKERTIQRINYRSPFERFFNGGGQAAGNGS